MTINKLWKANIWFVLLLAIVILLFFLIPALFSKPVEGFSATDGAVGPPAGQGGDQIDPKIYSEISKTFSGMFSKELHALLNAHALSGEGELDSGTFAPEILWAQKEGVWRPDSFSIAAQITKMIPGRPVERQLRYHGIWHTAFRDIAKEPEVARDAARAFFDFWHAIRQWEWAALPAPAQLNSSFVSFLADFEKMFAFYETHLNLGSTSDKGKKLCVIFYYLPFPNGEMADIKGVVDSIPFEVRIGRVLLSKTAQEHAGEKIAKQAFLVFRELLNFDIEKYRKNPLSPHPASPSTAFLATSHNVLFLPI